MFRWSFSGCIVVVDGGSGSGNITGILVKTALLISWSSSIRVQNAMVVFRLVRCSWSSLLI